MVNDMDQRTQQGIKRHSAGRDLQQDIKRHRTERDLQQGIKQHSAGREQRQDQERRWVLLILFLSFAAVLVLNIFTPMLSDDYAYAMDVREATSLRDLIVQEYHQYMTWNGRSVAHLLLRIFLFLPSPVFKVANSLAFAALSYVLARLAAPDTRCSWPTLLLVQLGLWLYAVDFAETVLWEDGACNYLWGALIIFTFLLLQRRILERGGSSLRGAGINRASRKSGSGRRSDSGRNRADAEWSGSSLRGRGIGEAAGLLLVGIVAGWCNENTSGGCLLALLLMLAIRKRRGAQVPIPFLAGLVGNAAGLAILVLSPGARLRASYATDENYSGFLGLLARFQKITLTIREYYGVLLAVLLVIAVILWVQNNRRGLERTAFCGLLFVATSYALIAARQTQPRAFFGAGLFLMIGIAGGIREILEEREKVLQAACWSLLWVLLLQFLFVYADNATNVGRIWRDERNRVAYIKEQAAQGATELTVPMVHTDFYNEYSAIEKMEMTEDPEYWINVFYEEYYGIASIRAIPYEEWEELQAAEEAE